MSTAPITAAAAIPMLKPVLALNLWTFTMWARMYQTRLPGMAKHNIKGQQAQTPGSLDRLLPPHTQWAAHNYNHLLEQPTQFYAVALTLAVLGSRDQTNVRLAWAYVGLRVLHSLIQASYNIVELRFATFAASTITAFALTARAAIEVFSQ